MRLWLGDETVSFDVPWNWRVVVREPLYLELRSPEPALEGVRISAMLRGREDAAAAAAGNAKACMRSPYHDLPPDKFFEPDGTLETGSFSLDGTMESLLLAVGSTLAPAHLRGLEFDMEWNRHEMEPDRALLRACLRERLLPSVRFASHVTAFDRVVKAPGAEFSGMNFRAYFRIPEGFDLIRPVEDQPEQVVWNPRDAECGSWRLLTQEALNLPPVAFDTIIEGVEDHFAEDWGGVPRNQWLCPHSRLLSFDAPDADADRRHALLIRHFPVGLGILRSTFERPRARVGEAASDAFADFYEHAMRQAWLLPPA